MRWPQVNADERRSAFHPRSSAAKSETGLWLRRYWFLQSGGDELSQSRIAAVMPNLIVSRHLRQPLFTTLFRLGIGSRGINRTCVRIDDAIHDNVELLERCLAFRRLRL